MSIADQTDLVSPVLDRVCIVLVKTTHAGNIGSVARACKTMGYSDLRLVSPKAAIDQDAKSLAAGAGDILQSARVFETLEEAVADCHRVIGASARSRKMIWPVAHPRDCAESLVNALLARNAGSSRDESTSDAQGIRAALVFGQEASGLSNDELQRCHQHVCIPANPNYSSLNLAMAVQVLTYELRMAALLHSESHPDLNSGLQSAQADMNDVRDAASVGWDEPIAEHGEVEGMLAHLEKALTALGYLDPGQPRMLMPRLRRLFMRAKMDKMEVNIVRGISKFILAHAKADK